LNYQNLLHHFYNYYLVIKFLILVLPPSSSKLLPKIYSILMTDENSKISQFYPKNFKIDYTGVNKEYKGVIILPFIDENLLFNSTKDIVLLKKSHIIRNSIKKNLIFLKNENKLTLININNKKIDDMNNKEINLKEKLLFLKNLNELKF
jgi:5'-3' exonuclease